MTSADVHGKFLWHELLTTDPGAAGAFYSRVLGWKSQAWDKDPSYSVWSSAKGPVGGLMKIPPEAAANGSSPHWIAYVGVRDVDATVANAQRLGGHVHKAPAQIPDGGRYALLTDPQNGLIGVYTPAASGASGSDSDEFAWHELATPDHAAAFRFYRELFGWEQLGIHDMGPAGQYLLFGRQGQTLGGMFNRPASMASSWPHWLIYAKVPSAQKAAEAASAAGGKVVNGPMQVPGGSWIAQLTDGQGAAIAVNQVQPAAAAAKTAAAAAPAKPAVAPAPPKPAPAAAPAPKPAAAPAPKPAAAPAPKPAAAPPPKPAAAPAPKPAAPSPGSVAPTPKPAAGPSAPAAAAAKAAAAPKAPPKTARPAAAPKKAKAKKGAAKKAAKKAKKTARKAQKAGSRRKDKASAARKRRKVASKRSARKVARKKAKKSARRRRR